MKEFFFLLLLNSHAQKLEADSDRICLKTSKINFSSKLFNKTNYL